MKKSHFFGDGDFYVICGVIFGDFFRWDWGTPAILRQNPNKITVLYGFGFKKLGEAKTQIFRGVS